MLTALFDELTRPLKPANRVLLLPGSIDKYLQHILVQLVIGFSESCSNSRSPMARAVSKRTPLGPPSSESSYSAISDWL